MKIHIIHKKSLINIVLIINNSSIINNFWVYQHDNFDRGWLIGFVMRGHMYNIDILKNWLEHDFHLWKIMRNEVKITLRGYLLIIEKKSRFRQIDQFIFDLIEDELHSRQVDHPTTWSDKSLATVRQVDRVILVRQREYIYHAVVIRAFNQTS